jgi:hypothetical protein
MPKSSYRRLSFACASCVRPIYADWGRQAYRVVANGGALGGDYRRLSEVIERRVPHGADRV